MTDELYGACPYSGDDHRHPCIWCVAGHILIAFPDAKKWLTGYLGRHKEGK